MSIRAKLIGFFTTVMLITGLSFSIIWYKDTLNMIDHYLQNFSHEVMENSYNAFSYILTDTHYILDLLATNDTNILKSLEKKSQSSLDQIQKRRKIEGVIGEMYGYKYYISGIGIISLTGEYYKVGLSSPSEDILEEIANKKLSFENSWQTAVLSPTDCIHSGSKDKLLPIVRPIASLRGELLGYALVNLDYHMVEEMLSENLPTSSHFQITNGQGDIIFSNAAPNDFTNSSKLNIFRLEDNYIYNQYYADQIDWYFDMGIPASKLLGNLMKTIQRTAIIYACIYLLALLIVLWFSYYISKRLGVLSHSMSQLSSGNLNVTVPSCGNDEIGQMATTFNHMVTQINELLAEVKTKEKQKRESELDFLQAQINPHFLSNTLNTVVWMANIQHAQNISNLTTSLISLLHSTMRHGRDFIKLSEELQHIESYIEIRRYSYIDNFEVIFKVPDELLTLMVPRFILQPIVENSLIHAIPTLTDRMGEIEISCLTTDTPLKISIYDNGIGMSDQQITQRLLDSETKSKKAFSSIGIKNVNDRIKLFFGEPYGLTIQSTMGVCTTVTITLPIIHTDQKGDKLDEN
ncbi:MAG TPA: histidine kinase [Clostridiales bacterium]|nr:histidine kinase [Clostridiales bacterium]